MTGNGKIAAALVGGYLLGRTKKAKMAIGFGMFLAGKKLNLDPKQLGRMLADSPVLGTLNEQVRKEVVSATKNAATNALTQRASGLADSLHRRTLALENPDGADSRDDGQDDEEYDDRAEARDDDHEDSDEEKPAPRRGTAAKSSSKSGAKSPAKSTGRSASGAGRSASGGARKKTSSAARTASSGARKTTSAARKERGGSNG
ncbi:hypothetical protein ABZ371_26925 [Streptomyces sp. NPDC005899]|uniref:hypothetical protein n=1 Tax=Streptomyces sp. NPDC005899 TaxID=3155716 RepID=UPI0033F2492A